MEPLCLNLFDSEAVLSAITKAAVLCRLSTRGFDQPRFKLKIWVAYRILISCTTSHRLS
jgi:hypothetical protein